MDGSEVAYMDKTSEHIAVVAQAISMLLCKVEQPKSAQAERPRKRSFLGGEWVDG